MRVSTGIRQKQIVDAAGRVIAKYGSEHITIKTIASETGITQGAIYKHFKSKRDILLLLVDHVEELLLDDLQVNGQQAEPVISFHTAMQRHIKAIENRSGFAFQIIAEIISLGDRDLNVKALSVINKYIWSVENMLREGQRNKLVRSDIDTRMAATLFFHMMQGLISMWALNSYSFDIKEEFKQIWSIYSNGIAPRDSIANGSANTGHRLFFS